MKSIVKHKYIIDTNQWTDEGGSCQVYPIKDYSNLVFKEFYTYKKATDAYKRQKKLAKFDLSPYTIGGVCKLSFAKNVDDLLSEYSNWGFITEYAQTFKSNTKIKAKDIQVLVDNIYHKTGLKFWDCHWYNVGIVRRARINKIVCIDTGRESFDSNCNAWGNVDPGPKCGYCFKYQCKCEE
jgi:hypothetical protein